jgi:hypothetical protein
VNAAGRGRAPIIRAVRPSLPFSEAMTRIDRLRRRCRVVFRLRGRGVNDLAILDGVNAAAP